MIGGKKAPYLKKNIFHFNNKFLIFQKSLGESFINYIALQERRGCRREGVLIYCDVTSKTRKQFGGHYLQAA